MDSMNKFFKRTLSLTKGSSSGSGKLLEVPSAFGGVSASPGGGDGNRPEIKVTDATPLEDGTMFDIEDMFDHRNKVPAWTSADVADWVQSLGFPTATVNAVTTTEVDGDLLLQLDEHNLKEDLQIKNGIHRKRFMRELNNLKKTADYSGVDTNKVAEFLNDRLGQESKVFAYNLIKNDLSPEYMRRLGEEDLQDMLREAGIARSIHRKKIIEAVYDSNPEIMTAVDVTDTRSYAAAADSPSTASSYTDIGAGADIFISFDKNSKSGELASLIEIELEKRGYSIKTSEGIGNHEHVLKHISSASNFVLVLTGQVLDGCIGDEGRKNLLHREIVAALEGESNIIPVIDNFQFPAPEELPADMRALCYFNAVRWVHDYQDACIGKIDRFVRGDSALYRGDSPTPGLRLLSSSLVNFPAALAHPSARATFMAGGSGRSTPARTALHAAPPPPTTTTQAALLSAVAGANRRHSAAAANLSDRRRWASMNNIHQGAAVPIPQKKTMKEF